MKKTTIGLLLATLITTSSAEVFDDNREGFLVGVGAGISRINSDVTRNTNSKFNIKNEYATGLATSLKIGYGFNNQFSAFLVRNASWFGYDNDKKDDTYVSGIFGLGINYYTSENGPLYLTAAYGQGDFMNQSDGETERGGALMLGVGYEVYPHVQIEGDWVLSAVDKSKTELSTSAFQLNVNYLWY